VGGGGGGGRGLGGEGAGWTATVEVKGQRFGGVVTDPSAGGARIKFDAAVQKGDELRLVLQQLNELGAKVVWQRHGEAGLSFVLAPEEVAAELRGKLSPTRAARPTAEPRPARMSVAPPAAGRPLVAIAAAAASVLVLLGLGPLFFRGAVAGEPVSTVVVGSADQHDCDTRIGKITSATNQVDFGLRVASAAEAKCLDLQHLGQSNSDRGGH